MSIATRRVRLATLETSLAAAGEPPKRDGGMPKAAGSATSCSLWMLRTKAVEHLAGKASRGGLPGKVHEGMKSTSSDLYTEGWPHHT